MAYLGFSTHPLDLLTHTHKSPKENRFSFGKLYGWVVKNAVEKSRDVSAK